MKWFLLAFKKYAQFSGRSRRKEYWMFTLFNILIYLASLAIIVITEAEAIGIVIYYIYALAVLLPNLAVSVRRLHDVGKSGWFIFISLIPIVGWIWYIVLLCTDSQEGENEYGSNPKMDDLDMETVPS